MAILSTSDFTQIRQSIRNDPDKRSLFKTWSLDKQTWYDVFQGAEDWFVNGFTVTPTTSFKTALEIEASAMTNAQAKAVGEVWMSWRFDKDL